MSEPQRLDLSLMERALGQLRRALAEQAAHPAVEAYRDSVVMRLVFTYELCMQAMTRYVQLEHTMPVPSSELTTPRIVRRANALGVLDGDWEQFALYRDARNIVVHAYDEAKAQRVLQLAAGFATQAQVLLERLQERLDD